MPTLAPELREWPAAPGDVQLMGVRFPTLDLDAAVTAVERLMATDELSHVVTVNLDYLAQIKRDPDLRATVTGADLAVADGVPLLWMARWSGQLLPGRVNGTDLMVRLLQIAGERGWPVAMLGGDPGVAEAAAVEAGRAWGTPIGGVWPLTRDEVVDAAGSHRIAAEVGALGKPLVLVALGAGRQDDWIAKNRHLLGGGVVIGVGSALDFVAGTRSRAPRLFQRLGFEWLWRMLLEPRRLWRRYLVEDMPLLAGFAVSSVWARMRGA
ncbi:MAG TPA: WecB/TagA/CpsF family glycosyltransferase [Acidimicrobiales bacterium]|jgi:exopolysaccharide biosynthesis WecB/TagA/CpsF family protein|nr:WecB/TagA/CpsF family glycosyltransferase [Acidimicrobiales bacterium]